MVKQEAESCSSAVNHRIPEGFWFFFSQPGSCYRVCVSLTFIVRLTSHFGLLGEQVEILKKPDESKLGHLGLSCHSPVCKPEMRSRGPGVSAVLFWHQLVFMIVAVAADGHGTASELTRLCSVFVRVILYAFLHDQICLCGPSIDVCMLAHAFLCMNVHTRVCV